MSSIADFLNSDVFAVAGASRDKSKYGYQVFRALLDSGRKVYPINPNAQEIEGYLAFSSIAALPEMPQSLSVVTPPSITETIIGQAIEAGIQGSQCHRVPTIARCLVPLCPLCLAGLVVVVGGVPVEEEEEVVVVVVEIEGKKEERKEE